MGATATAAAAAVGAFLASPLGASLTLALTLGTSYYSYREQKKAERKARNARGLDVRHSGSAQPVPICYGRCGVPGIPVYSATSNRFTVQPLTAQKIGALPSFATGKRNEYLLTQWVLSAGAIDRVLDVWESDRPTTRGELAGLIVTEWQRGGTASAMATGFTGADKPGECRQWFG